MMFPNHSDKSFSDYFAKLCKEIECQVNDWIKREKDDYGRVKFNEVLDVAVKSWCDQLNIYDEETDYINEWLKNNINILKTFWNIQKDLTMKKFKLTGQIDLILLIAFGVVIVAITLSLLNKQSNQEERQFRKNQSVSAPPIPDQNKDTSWILLLVINSAKDEIRQSLETSRRVTTNHSDALYRATQALWMGSKADFEQSELKSWFSGNRVVLAVESEYDVYFVRIDLDEHDSGFNPDANQIDRIDAFRRLPDNSGKVEVSDRLPSKAYENKLLYSR